MTAEVIDALARRNFEAEQGDSTWGTCPEDAKPGWVREAAAQAATIAPYLLAAGWDEAISVLYRAEVINSEHLQLMINANPHRSKP